MAQNELLEDTVTSELDELDDVTEPDLDDFGDDEAMDDDFEGLSSDLDRWGDDEDYYGGGYSDRDYINGLFR